MIVPRVCARWLLYIVFVTKPLFLLFRSVDFESITPFPFPHAHTTGTVAQMRSKSNVMPFDSEIVLFMLTAWPLLNRVHTRQAVTHLMYLTRFADHGPLNDTAADLWQNDTEIGVGTDSSSDSHSDSIAPRFRVDVGAWLSIETDVDEDIDYSDSDSAPLPPLRLFAEDADDSSRDTFAVVYVHSAEDTDVDVDTIYFTSSVDIEDTDVDVELRFYSFDGSSKPPLKLGSNVATEVNVYSRVEHFAVTYDERYGDNTQRGTIYVTVVRARSQHHDANGAHDDNDNDDDSGRSLSAAQRAPNDNGKYIYGSAVPLWRASGAFVQASACPSDDGVILVCRGCCRLHTC